MPGLELTYACETTYLQGGEETARIEHWSYLVRALDDRGQASLEGRLTGLGAGMTLGGVPLDAAQLDAGREREVERLSEDPVSLSLTMDGWVQISWGSWADQLPHRVLGLTLPEDAVAPGDTWPAPAAARPYADLLPIGLELEIAATNRLESVTVRDGLAQAQITTEGHVRPADPALPGGVELRGEAWWDLRSGRLLDRTLELRSLAESNQEETERLRVTLHLIQ